MFATTSTRVGGALLWHGTAIAARIPGGLNPAAITEQTAQIHFA
ncbi:hypothetical protein [Streptomyces hainanensis]|nr:hypothetical protein [Streptomyces hainanensis]